MSRIVKTLTTPQTARARMRAGRGFEAEATVSVSPVGLLAVGGLVAAILLSVPPIVRAARLRGARPQAPMLPVFPRHGETRALPAPRRTERQDG